MRWIAALFAVIFAGCGSGSAQDLTTARSSTGPSATTSTSAAESHWSAYLTGYSWWDNTPPGSPEISNPVIHTIAGGTGTYADPITLAVGHAINGKNDRLDFPAGTRFYVPNLRRYLIVEDTCGDGRKPQNGSCHIGYPKTAKAWLDLWIGGRKDTSKDHKASNDCMDAITGTWTVIQDPAPTYAVATGAIYGTACTRQYGNTVVRA